MDAVTISEEIGVRKPERVAFEVAAARCGSTPSRDVWFIGDNPETDIVGALEAGLSTIWVGDTAEWPSHLPSSDRSSPDVRGAITELLTEVAQ